MRIAIILQTIGVCALITSACKEGNKDVGICLHVYLERDFLSLESIVYPSSEYDRLRMDSTLHYERGGRKNNAVTQLNNRTIVTKAAPGSLLSNNHRRKYLIEGTDLDDHCSRLREVVTCFEKILMDCETSFDFFRYRHLLHALSEAHTFVCASTHLRQIRFLRFLKTIDCAEKARKYENTCFRHNVSSIVWNQILRLEVGEEICHSLNTQRACLLDQNYIDAYCGDSEKVEIYSDLSSYFLSIWCHLPINPKLAMKMEFILSAELSIYVKPIYWQIIHGILISFLLSTLYYIS